MLQGQQWPCLILCRVQISATGNETAIYPENIEALKSADTVYIYAELTDLQNL
jgi:hypothetical protein